MFKNSEIENTIIFGSSGFIGKHFINELKEHTNIVKYDISGNHLNDVRKKIHIKGHFNANDLIINLAAIHKTPGHPDYNYFETNLMGAQNVCDFAESKKINNIVFTSSIAPYGASEEVKREDSLPTPNTPYGISKLVAEHIHKNWQAKDYHNRKLIILRPGIVFGKGENGNFTRLYKAIKQGFFFYPGRKDTKKACIYVKDLIDMVEQIYKSFNYGVKLYNFTYEPAPEIKEIVETLCLVTALKTPKFSINGYLLKFSAGMLKTLGGEKMGIHPDRVKKLMLSTNISGEKLIKEKFEHKFGLKCGIKDWFADCGKKGLF